MNADRLIQKNLLPKESSLISHCIFAVITSDFNSRDLGVLRSEGISTERLQRCTEGCLLPVEMPDDSDAEDSVQETLVKLEFQAGIPRLFPGLDDDFPFTKRITLMSEESKHTMYVVITGQYSKDPNPQSIPLPTHKPLMILRDPPGGNSQVTYSNVESTMKISINNYEKYAGE